MTAPAKKIFTVGLNAARIYDLDQDSGRLAATGATVYNGLSVGGPMTFSYEPPDPTSIVHPGNNMILQRDSLPSQDTSSATLEVSRTDYDTIALLSNTKVRVFGDVNSIGWGTNQAGTEPTVALVTYAQGKLTTGVRSWSTYVFPKATITPKPKDQSREQQNAKYFVQPNVVTAHLTGLAATISDDGFTATEVFEYQSNYRLNFATWATTAGVEVDYIFDTLLPYAANAGTGITVTKNDVLMTYGVTADSTHYVATASKITFGAALTSGDIVVAMYELAESAVDIS
jgi:hypothetical protein